MEKLFAVLLGGGIGAYLRYLLSFYPKKYFNFTCKATFVINIVGCLLLGIILAAVHKAPGVNAFKYLSNPSVKLFLTTGIIGSFTTFSTFAHENITMLKDGEIFKSFAYTTSSLLVGLLAVFCGFYFINLIY